MFEYFHWRSKWQLTKCNPFNMRIFTRMSTTISTTVLCLDHLQFLGCREDKVFSLNSYPPEIFEISHWKLCVFVYLTSMVDVCKHLYWNIHCMQNEKKWRKYFLWRPDLRTHQTNSSNTSTYIGLPSQKVCLYNTLSKISREQSFFLVSGPET